MIRRFVEFTVRHPILIIIGIGILTLFFAYQIWNPWMAGRCLTSLFKDETACWWSWKLKMVVDPKTILPQDHPYVQLNDRIEKTFGGSRVVVIGIEPRNGDIFNTNTLTAIKEITEEIKKIPGIKEENVVSISDRKVKHVESSGQVIKVQKLMDAIPETTEELEAFRARVYSNDLFVGSLVSRDGKAAAIITDFREWVPASQESSEFGVSSSESREVDPEKQAAVAGSSQENPWWKGKEEGKEAGIGTQVAGSREGADKDLRTTEHESGPTANTNPWWQGDQSEGDWPSGGSQGYGGFRMSDSAIYEAIQKATSSGQSASGGLDTNVYIGGLPVALAFLEKDSARIVYLFPLALLIMMFILYWAFRSFQGMLLPLLTALLSVVWALGMMGLSGIPMDPFNTLTPILILAVAAGHSIQILKRYYEELEVTGDNRAAVIEATSKIAPVTITAALVAAASFGSLVTFQLKTFQAFGLFTAFGILSALVLELTFIPALRSVMRPPRVNEAQGSKLKAQSDDQESRITPLDRALSAIARQSTGGHPWVIGGATSLILIIAIVGASMVRVDNSLKSQFFESTRLRIDEKALNRHFGGTSTFYILIEGDQPNVLKDPAVLTAVDGLQRRLEAVSGVGKTESYVDYVKKMNQTFHGGDPQYNRVPEDRQQVADFLFLYAISGNPADFARLVDYDYRQAVIWSYLKSDSTVLAEDLIRLVEGYAREHSSLFEIAQGSNLPAGQAGVKAQGVAESSRLKAEGSKVKEVSSKQLAVKIEDGEAQSSTQNSELRTHNSLLTLGVAGSAPVTVALNRTMVEGKIKNILQIAAIILVASAIVLRSWIGGLLVLLPLGLAVLINFGVMGLSGITLGIGTAAISAMAVGIGADYAIYLLFRIREEYRGARSSKLKGQRDEGEAQSSRLKAQSSGIEAQSDQQTPVDFHLSALSFEQGEAQGSKVKAQGEGSQHTSGSFQLSAFSFQLETAVQKALMTSGKAIVFVALSISAGYAILPFSGYYLHMEGILVPLAMITSCIGALVLLPTMVYTFKPRFIVGEG